MPEPSVDSMTLSAHAATTFPAPLVTVEWERYKHDRENECLRDRLPTYRVLAGSAQEGSCKRPCKQRQETNEARFKRMEASMGRVENKLAETRRELVQTRRDLAKGVAALKRYVDQQIDRVRVEVTSLASRHLRRGNSGGYASAKGQEAGLAVGGLVEAERRDNHGGGACRHFCHDQCIKQWWAQDHSCPICRTRPETSAAEQGNASGQHFDGFALPIGRAGRVLQQTISTGSSERPQTVAELWVLL
ncbi:hypothetical protein BC832DRAFT_615707 [Gaertneriomyces semiglobifer]|nr:hypothetical protein BC832DRAFT_615707 [Gaertneriomyces semiglobifer]